MNGMEATQQHIRAERAAAEWEIAQQQIRAERATTIAARPGNRVIRVGFGFGSFGFQVNRASGRNGST